MADLPSPPPGVKFLPDAPPGVKFVEDAPPSLMNPDPHPVESGLKRIGKAVTDPKFVA